MSVSHSVQFHVVMHFRKLTQFLWYSLNTLNRFLGTCIEDKKNIYYALIDFSNFINSAVILCGYHKTYQTLGNTKSSLSSRRL